MKQATSEPTPTLRRPAPQRANDLAPPQALLLISAIIEAMMGRRALHQLRPHLALDAFGRLVEYADEGNFRRTMVGRIRVQMPTLQAIEACVRLASASRWLSCVIRLDGEQSGWRCTDLVVLRPPLPDRPR